MAPNTTGVAVPAVVPVAPAKSTGVTALSGPAYQRTRYPNSKGRLEPVQAPSACAVEGAEDDGPAEDDELGGGRGAERGQERGPEEDGGDENPGGPLGERLCPGGLRGDDEREQPVADRPAAHRRPD